jgi:hypothetical protein
MTIEQARLGILPKDIQEYFDERAGVYEFEGEIPRNRAELLAFEDIKIILK